MWPHGDRVMGRHGDRAMGRLWIILALCVSGIASQELQIHRYKRVCYLAHESFSRHNPAGRFSLTQHVIAPFLCTHVVYTHCTIGANHTVLPASPDDVDPVTGVFARLNALKAANPSLKVLVAIQAPAQGGKAGKGEGAAFDALVRSDEALVAFGLSLVEFVRRNGLNGAEIDWPKAEMNGLTRILRHVRAVFTAEGKSSNRPRLLLATSVSHSIKHIANNYDFPALNRLVDFLSLRSCDYHDSRDLKTGMNSPLHPSSPTDTLSIESSVTRMLAEGARADLLVVALCAKGSSFTLVSDLTTDVNSETSGPGIQGPFVQKLGSMAYFEVCVVLREKGQRLWHDQQKCPYLLRDRLWIGYDDPDSIQEKSYWIVDQHLGGAAIWRLDLDDFSGLFCKQGDFPLASTMAKTLKAADVKFFHDGFEPSVPTSSEVEETVKEAEAKEEDGNDVSNARDLSPDPMANATNNKPPKSKMATKPKITEEENMTEEANVAPQKETQTSGGASAVSMTMSLVALCAACVMH